MKRFAVGLALLVSGLACSENGRSLVLVRVAPISSVDRVRVVVAQDGGSKAHYDQAVASDGTFNVGVYVPKTVAGQVDIIACGFMADTLVAVAETTDRVSAGQTTGPLSLTLVPGSSLVSGLSSLCLDADGGAGGSGASGAGGGDATAGAGAAGSGGAGDGAAGTSGASGTSAAGAGGGSVGVGGSGGADAGGGGGTAGGGAGTGGGGSKGAGGGGGSTHAPAWGPAQIVSNNSALAESVPHVAVSSKGKAVAVFTRGSEIWSNSYDPDTHVWATPVPIDQRPQLASAPLVAVDKNDTYLAVWSQDPNQALKGIWWSSSADAGAHWSAPLAITTTAAFSPALAVNADGVAVVAWTESASDFWQLGASFRAASGAAWSTPVTNPANQFETNDRDASVAVSGKGEAFVTWHQDDKGAADEDSVWEMHHTDAGWSAANLLESYDAGPCFAPHVAANSAGIVIATWLEVGADAVTTETIRARRWAFGGSDFGPPWEVASGGPIDNFQAPALVVDEAGVAVVAWAFEIQSKWQVFAGRTDATGVQRPDLFSIETDDAATEDNPNDASVRATEPALVVDPTGNVTLVWRKRLGKRFDAWSRRLPKGAGEWTTATLIETRDIGSVEWPALGVGADGTVIAVWDYTVEPDIWAVVLR